MTECGGHPFVVESLKRIEARGEENSRLLQSLLEKRVESDAQVEAIKTQVSKLTIDLWGEGNAPTLPERVRNIESRHGFVKAISIPVGAGLILSSIYGAWNLVLRVMEEITKK